MTKVKVTGKNTEGERITDCGRENRGTTVLHDELCYLGDVLAVRLGWREQ